MSFSVSFSPTICNQRFIKEGCMVPSNLQFETNIKKARMSVRTLFNSNSNNPNKTLYLNINEN